MCQLKNTREELKDEESPSLIRGERLEMGPGQAIGICYESRLKVKHEIRESA